MRFPPPPNVLSGQSLGGFKVSIEEGLSNGSGGLKVTLQEGLSEAQGGFKGRVWRRGQG